MSEYTAIIDAGKRIGDVKTAPGGRAYTVLGDGDAVHDLEHLLEQPARVRAQIMAHEPQTFIAYFQTYKDTEESVIFADTAQFQVVGIIDYHSIENGPAWCSHRLTYTAPRATEWMTWRNSSGKRMSQSDFAQFIEDNQVDIRTPPGAQVLEVARDLQAKKSVEFSSAIRTATGAQEFTYNESIDGTSAKGKLRIPETFTLGIPVFRGDAAYEVTARLRYRIDGGKLQLWYDLYRPEALELDAFTKVTDDIGEKTQTPIWQGVAPKGAD